MEAVLDTDVGKHSVAFGDVCKDSLTSFTGQVTAVVLYAHGTDQVYLENENNGRWFEASRLVLIRAAE